MKRLLRLGVSAAVAAAALYGSYRFCYLRYLCNLRGARAERSVSRLFSDSDQIAARIAARDIESDMSPCIECWRTNVAFYMIDAAALRMLGRLDDAAGAYRQALRFDRRAEIYLNLGLTELDAGREAQAADALTTAVLLQYSYIDDIPEPMQTRIRKAVTPTYEMIQRREAVGGVVKGLRERVTRDPA